MGYLPPAHSGRPQPQRLVPAEDSPWAAQRLAAGLGAANSGNDALPDHLALQFGHGRKDMQNELRRGITLIRVDVLGGSDEANAERPA